MPMLWLYRGCDKRWEMATVPKMPNNKPVKTYTADDFKCWGAQGGKKSRRVLTAAQAKAMVAARERKRRKNKRVVRRANAEVSEAADKKH